MEKYAAAFESWQNGGTQVSPLILCSQDGQDAVDRFIEDNTGSFATLHLFKNEDEAILEYNNLIN